jgi:iron complex outermembrane recepter protein
MRCVRVAPVGAMLACLPIVLVNPAQAQEPPAEAVPAAAQQVPAPEAAASAPVSDPNLLPEIVVESAPAKRNIKKQSLRASGGGSAGVADAGALDGSGSTELPGIVVEGEKVVRTLRDTTTSIGVVTGQQIEDERIEDLQGALNSQANVLATEGSGGNGGFTIRGLNSEGLTNNQNPSAAPLVSVVIDGATQNPEATRRGARALWDVEQVEILRGPQSALQARNSLAGSVFIKTKDPTYKWETIIEGTAGNHDLKSGGFVVNAPIVTNQAALRISGMSMQRNHGISYADPQNDPLDEDVLRSLRGKLLLEPDSMPGLSALFTIARVQDTPAVMTVSAPFFNRELSVDPTASVDFRSTETTNYISDIGYTVYPGVTIRSITAYADTETEIGSATSALYQRDVIRDGGDFTQDLRVEIENSGNGLSGVVGLFYGSFKYDNDTVDTFDYSFGAGAFVLPIQDLVTSVETESMAAYADLRYRFWDKFVVIGGGRMLRDEISNDTSGEILYNALTFAGVPDYRDLDGSFTNSFTEFLPRVGLTYDLTPDQTIGVTYNKGYRNGYTEFRLPLAAFNEVKPEYLDAYEVSYRSDWLNKSLSFNGNVFYYDYKDQQVAFDEELDFTGTGTGLGFPLSYILNADSSHSYGAEFEARWRPIAPLQLYGSLGLMRTEFDSFNSANGDFSGNEFPEAPAYTVSFGGMYRHPMGWFAGANMRHTDGYYSGGDLQNSSLRFVDGYTLVDARVGWEWEHYKLTVFAKNLFDEQYVTGKSFGASQATAGDEQLVGVTLSGRF